MKKSAFGERFTRPSGIGRLMEDLGDALGREDMLMLGGGNPARVPAVEEALRPFLREQLDRPGGFGALVGDYDEPAGHLPFREALAELLSERFGRPLTARNIALTHGSQSAFFILFNLFAGKMPDGSRRRILLPLTPEYIGYADLGLEPDLFTACKPRIEPLDDHLFKYRVDFAALETSPPDIGAVCVSRPTNPTGNVLTDEEIERLDRFARARGIPFLIDSAYGTPFPDIIYTGARPFWNENTVVCLSLSKFGLPALRTGIVVAREEIVEAVAAVNGVTALAPGGFGPRLVEPIVRSREILRLSCERIRPFYRERAETALDAFRDALSAAGVPFRIHRPEGAFFLWIHFPGLPRPSAELYRRLKERGLVVVPGEYFFFGLEETWPHSRECLRVSYARPAEEIVAAARLLADEVRRLFRSDG